MVAVIRDYIHYTKNIQRRQPWKQRGESMMISIRRPRYWKATFKNTRYYLIGRVELLGFQILRRWLDYSHG